MSSNFYVRRLLKHDRQRTPPPNNFVFLDRGGRHRKFVSNSPRLFQMCLHSWSQKLYQSERIVTSSDFKKARIDCVWEKLNWKMFGLRITVLLHT